MHMDNLNTIVLHLAVKVQHVRRPRRLGRSRGDALSEEDLVGCSRSLEDAAPSKQQLRDARCPRSCVAAARRRPTTQATEGRIGQGRIAAPHVRRGATLHNGRDHRSSLCGWSSRGAAARGVRATVCGTANAGCPHAVVNVAPSDAMMLKLGIDFGAGPSCRPTAPCAGWRPGR
jgi:hypothetical protein